MYTEMAVITAHTTPATRQTSMLPDTGDQLKVRVGRGVLNDEHGKGAQQQHRVDCGHIEGDQKGADGEHNCPFP